MDYKEKNALNPHRHPWEIAKVNSILSLTKDHPLKFQYADIGAGDQYFVSELAQLASLPIYAVDIVYESADEAVRKNDKIIECKETKDIPKQSVDCIFLMDILEHLEDDSAFLKDIIGLLKEEGKLIITVPAHQFLFTPHDEFLGHYRRYGKKRLLNLLLTHQLQIKECFYYNFLPLVIRFTQLIMVKLGLIKKMDKGIGDWQLARTNIITVLLAGMLNLDFVLNRFLQRFKITSNGLSLCVVCQKKSV